MRTLNANEMGFVAGGVIDTEEQLTHFMSEGISVYSPNVVTLDTVIITGHATGTAITFTDGAVGTLLGAAARGALTEFAAAFAIGAGITLAPAVIVGLGVAAAAIGLVGAWAVANANAKYPMTAEP